MIKSVRRNLLPESLMENVEPARGLPQKAMPESDREPGVSGTFSAKQSHSRETLARSQKRFRYAFLTSPDSVAIIRAQDRVYTEVNEMFCLFFGYEKGAQADYGKNSTEQGG